MTRRGRPRHKVPRVASGRPSRARAAIAATSYYRDETEVQATATALAARRRLFAVPEDIAKDPALGSLIGRMYLGGVVTQDQYEAARYWLRVRQAFLMAIAAPGTPVEPREGVRGTETPDEHEARVRAATAKHEAMEKWVRDGDDDPGRTLNALVLFLVTEQHIPALVVPLLRALDRIDAFCRQGRKRPT
jgi:hypothetical protein